MARGLVGSGQVELGIIGTASVSGSVRRDYCGVRQWLFPSRTTLGRDGLPPAQFVDAIAEASREFRPDLVHVWGTESYWGLLSARRLLPYPSLLEMQGSKSAIARVYCGALTFGEQLRCVGIKEVIKRKTIWSDRRAFARWGSRERDDNRSLLYRYPDAMDGIASQGC